MFTTCISRTCLISTAHNQPVMASVVGPPPVNMMALVVKCVTSTTEGSSAHVHQASRDTGVNSHLLDLVKTSRWFTKKQPMVFTTFSMNRASHSQTTATLVPSLVSHGLWSSLTPCKTMTCLRAKQFTCTTCQSPKMYLNGTTTVCQCPLWSPSKMSPLTGEPLVIFRPMA